MLYVQQHSSFIPMLFMKAIALYHIFAMFDNRFPLSIPDSGAYL